MARSGALLEVVDSSLGVDLHEIELLAEGMPDEFVRCRELGHNMVPHTVTRYRNAFERTLRCTRCKVRKHQRIDSYGMFQGHPTYEYPEGYLIKGYGPMSGRARGVIRLASLERGRVTEVNEELE